MECGRNRNILLVEDDPFIAMVEKQQLEKRGYRVCHVSDGESAVKTILEEACQVDLILMDIDLGSGMDGTEAAEEILSRKEIPVVFLSAHVEPEIVEKTERITSYGYVVKNSGITVLDASIKMAYKLFDAKRSVEEKEAELAQNEERFRSFFDCSAVGIAQISPQGEFLMVNSKLCDMTGYSEKELSAMTFAEITHPDDLALDHQHISDVLAGKKDAFELDKRYIHKCGRVFWIRLFSNAVRNPDGSVKYAVATVADIDQSIQMLNALTINEYKFQKIVETSPYGIEEVDLEGRMVYLNDAFHRLLGYQPGELAGSYIWDHEPTEEHVTKLQEYFQYLIRERPDPEPYVSQNVKKNGEIIDVHVDWNYMYDRNGELSGFISVVKQPGPPADRTGR